VPTYALSSHVKGLLGDTSMQKIHEDLRFDDFRRFDRAIQRVGMLLWWAVLIGGLGTLLTHVF
jgi:hypothetical protein